MKKTLISLSVAALLGSLSFQAAATSRLVPFDSSVAGAEEKSSAVIGSFQVAREASEGPRGKDNERPGDRQHRGGRAALSADPVSGAFQVAREASEGPRGKDNERPGDRQHRGGRAALSADPVSGAFQIAREASEGPRGKDNERPGDRQHRGGRA